MDIQSFWGVQFIGQDHTHIEYQPHGIQYGIVGWKRYVPIEEKSGIAYAFGFSKIITFLVSDDQIGCICSG